MRHSGTIRLETPRLILRRFVVEDAGMMYDRWASDPEVTRYLTWQPHASPQATAELLECWVADYANPECYNWVLELRDIGCIIGNCSVVRIDENIEEMELGWCMSRAEWGKGYMPEAAVAIRDYLFNMVGIHRLCAKHDVDNVKSGRVMQKIGMQMEGVRRRGFRGNRGIVDVACYAMLAADPRPLP